MALWTSDEAAAATGGRANGKWSVTELSIDTRSIAPGDLFVALTAARDGHDFVADALAKGAGAALVSRIPKGVSDDAPLLIVEDVQTALEDLGRAARDRTSAKIIAVTGSVGKTSTKDMLAHVLRAQGATHAAVKSFNNHWGVPLTLARMPAASAFAVIEIGMNHPGEIAPLAAQAQPHVAMVTTVGPVHLEAFDDGIDGIAREKAAIFSGLVTEGTSILNSDLDQTEILRSEARGTTVAFGRAETADWRLLDVQASADSLTCVAQTPEGRLLFKIGAPGVHFAMNALGVLAAVHAAGGDVARAAMDLATWTPPDGRGARHFVSLDGAREGVGFTLIDDAYNANPTSIAASLATLAATRVERGGRRIAVLGDMKELGLTEDQLHADLADLPAMAEIDQIHCVGPLMSHLHGVLPDGKRGQHAQMSSELAAQAHHIVGPGDIVLVKGSLSMDMARVVDALSNLGQARGNAK